MQRFMILTAFSILFFASRGATAQEMALAERRAVQSYQEKIYPGLLKSIQMAAGTEVPVEVNWPLLAIAGQAAKFDNPEFWTDIFFTPLSDAFRRVASDAAGKTAVKDKIKKIVVTYDEATAPAANYDNGVSFEGGVLTLNFTPNSNTADVKPRADAIVKLLESKL